MMENERHEQGLLKSAAAEVARRAGVSLSTVSRVFRDHPKVADSTRRRVLEAAEAVGYQPSIAARALRTGRFNCIGLILQDATVLRGQFHADALGGIEAILTEHLFRLMLCIRAPRRPIHEICRELASSGQCGGFIVEGTQLASGDVSSLRALAQPIVLMNYEAGAEGGPDLGTLGAVGFDNRGGVRSAVRHLAALGHRRLAFIGGTPSAQDARLREVGFRQALAELGLEIREQWICPGHFGHGHGGFDSGSLQMEHLLAETSCGPTGVVCASDEIAVGTLTAIQRCGRSVPADISVVGFDNHSWSSHCNPPLTTVAHDGWLLGCSTAEAILRRLDNPQAQMQPLIHPTQLIVRDSTQAPPREFASSSRPAPAAGEVRAAP